jgi:hypothetical protein
LSATGTGLKSPGIGITEGAARTVLVGNNIETSRSIEIIFIPVDFES